MISIFMLICVNLAIAKDLKAAKYMHAFFLLFLIITAVVKIPYLYLLPIAGIYAIVGIYALFIKWPEYHLARQRSWKNKWIKHPAEVLAHRSFVWLFKFIPLPVVSWFGGKLLEFAGPRVKKRQRLTKNNLANVAPEFNNPEFIKKMWNGWGRAFAEGLKFDTYKRHMNKYVTFKNKELLDNSQQFIITMPHLGYMGLMALAFVGSPKRIAVTYKFPRNPLSNDVILRSYGLGQVDEVSFIPTGNAFPLMRAVKNGEIININSDQRASEGEILDFLGKPAKTSTGLAQLACKFNLPVLVAHVVRTRGAHHEIVFDEVVHMPKTDNPRDNEMIGMQMVNDAMGRAIMQSPVEYLWAHRRWEKFQD